MHELSYRWTARPLGELLTSIDAGRSPELPDRPAMSDEWGVLKVSAVRPEGLQAAENKAVVRQGLVDRRLEVCPGDLVITRANTPDLVGLACLVQNIRPHLMLSDKTLRLNIDHRVADSRFIAYALATSSVRRQIGNAGTGSSGSMKNISQSDIRLFRVPCPPVVLQKEIARILSSVDESIHSTERLIAKLKKVKVGLLQCLMTPCSSWRITSLGALADAITSGSRAWGTYYAETGALFIRIGNLTREHINLRFDHTSYVRPPNNSELRRTAINVGDVLISITADLGIVGVAPADLGEAYVNQHIALVRPNTSIVSGRWIAHYLASPQGQRQFAVLNDSGAKAGLNLKAIGNLEVAIPQDRDSQQRIVATLDEADARVGALKASAAKLRELKQGLMEDLLTGRVRVRVREA